MDISVGSRSAPGSKDATVSLPDEENCGTEQQTSKLFTCPVDGCVKQFQRYCSLENHLAYGTCNIVLERENLFDMARIIYRDKLLLGCGVQPVLESYTLSAPAEEIQRQGWALKMGKKATRFNERQKRYLDEKFSIGQETGHKLEAATVAQDMRYAKDEGGNRRFTVDEFLTPQQVQSYFSRTAAKLKYRQEGNTEEDKAAAEDQASYSLTRATILENCQLVHPIVFDSYNLCNLNASKAGLKQLSIIMLRSICEYFDLNVADIPRTRKAPYVQLLRSIVQTCSCTSPN